LPDGTTNPGALDVELDIPVTTFHTPVGAPYVRIWGVSLTDIAQASDFNPPPNGGPGKTIAVYGGFAKGLPLAKPEQARLLVTGMIQQAFSNWVGTDMTLDFMFTGGNLLANADANFNVNWLAGTPMSGMISSTMKTVFPVRASGRARVDNGYTFDVKISPKLVLNHDEVGFYGTLFQFAEYVNRVSKDIIKDPAYPGVQIALQDRAFTIQDGTTPKTPIQIAFNDLVGQITWKAPNTISMNCVMRGDLQVGDYIKLPPGQITTTAQSYSQYRQGVAFAGTFQINSVRHVGRSRNPDGLAWLTVFEAVLQ
jgi:hypothetical protein